MITLTGIVRRGTVDLVDPEGLAEQRRINQLGPGFGARMHRFTKRYSPGQKISLPASEMMLVHLGVCELVPGSK